MLKIHHEDPVIIDRTIGYLDTLESTHHYCRAGYTPDGTILATYGLHPDLVRPADVYVRVDVPGAKYPVYRFNPREAHPDYRWPFMTAYCRSEDGGRTWSEPTPGVGCSGGAPVGDKTLCPNEMMFHVEPRSGCDAYERVRRQRADVARSSRCVFSLSTGVRFARQPEPVDHGGDNYWPFRKLRDVQNPLRRQSGDVRNDLEGLPAAGRGARAMGLPVDVPQHGWRLQLRLRWPPRGHAATRGDRGYPGYMGVRGARPDGTAQRRPARRVPHGISSAGSRDAPEQIIRQRQDMERTDPVPGRDAALSGPNAPSNPQRR